MSITAAQLVSSAREFIGVRYRHQGHDETGVDCIGLLFAAAERAGLDILEYCPLSKGEAPPKWDYSRRPTEEGLARMRRWSRQLATPVPGCVIFFQFPQAADPQHFAIFTGDTIVHALAIRQRVLEQSYREPWLRWTHSIWTVPGVRYG